MAIDFSDCSKLPRRLRKICEKDESVPIETIEKYHAAANKKRDSVSPPRQVVQIQPLQPKATTMTLSDRIISFVKTQAKSAVTGLADQETIDARLAICQQCPHLKADHCQKCGCACGGGKKYLNKLAHKSSVCPANPPRWGAVE